MTTELKGEVAKEWSYFGKPYRMIRMPDSFIMQSKKDDAWGDDISVDKTVAEQFLHLASEVENLNDLLRRKL